MENVNTYQDALDYLYGFVDYSLTRSFRYSPEQFDLGRMYAFMDHLGEPHKAYPVIHIAGTKGKGSVAAMCASALQAAGYEVGLYTSPHLQDYCERIQINTQPISTDQLVKIVQEFKPYLDRGTKLTTFEITTALAFLYFARQGATAVVAEVGLGGRLDATNVVTPTVSAITSISYDHTDILGEKLSEIAAEKAGIIKKSVPVVVAPQKDEARLVIERIADERNAPLIQVGRDYMYAPVSHSGENQSLLVWESTEQASIDLYIETGGLQEWEPTRLEIPLLGYHQIENAATAYAVLKVANNYGLTIGDADVQRGFSKTTWPGRFEILRREPPVVIDSAHNRDSALKLRLALDDYFPLKPVVLVFGASEDKDIEGMFTELMPRIQFVIATKSIHPRALDPKEIVDLAHRYGKPAKMTQIVEDALREAIHLADNEAIVLVTGSIFIAAGARQTWYNEGFDRL